jgi:large subunit ribosomal protein L30
MKTIKVRLLKSVTGCKQSHRDTVRGLGLKRINSVRELVDTPAVRGMINKVNYLVRIE